LIVILSLLHRDALHWL